MAIPAENMTRAIWTLTGQMHALFMVCQAMAKAHPNQDLVATVFEKATQEGLAYLENQSINDGVLVGYKDTIEAFNKILRK